MLVHTGTAPDSVERTFLIVDDHHLVREAFERLVKTEWPNSKIVGFDFIDDVVGFVGTERADIVIFSADDRTRPSVATVRSIRASWWGTRVLLSQFEGTVEEELELFWAGVSACVPKRATSLNFVGILKLVTAGGAYISAEAASSLVRSREIMLPNSPATRRSLSAREYALLESLKLGLSNKEIARSWQISESAVKLYLRNLFHKLQVRSRTEAVVTGIRMGIFENDEARALQTVRQVGPRIAEEADPVEKLGKRR